MLSRLDYIFGIGLPIVIGLVGVLISGRIGAGIAPGIALAVAAFAIAGWPTQWPPSDSLMWIGFVAIAVALVALRNAIVELPTELRVLSAAIVSFFVVYLVTGNFRSGLASGQWYWVAALSAAMLILWLSSELVVRRTSARNSALLFMLLAGTSAVVMALTGSQSMGNREGTIALAMVSSLIFGGRASAMGFVPLWGMIMIVHYVYGVGVPTTPMVLLAISPLCWWAGDAVKNERWKKVLRVAGALVPQIIALTIVAIEFSHHLDEL